MISQQQQERERQRQEQKQRLYNMVRTGRQLNNYWNNRDKFGFNKPNPNALTSNASTNTIANYASPNMAAAPSINNPATYNMSTQLGGATTPTLSNASTGTTLSNFGTQGATAMNGGAMASSTPIAGAVASEAGGAGMGAAGAGLGAVGTEAATTAGAGTLAGAGTATAGTGAAMGGAGAAGAAGGAAAGAGTAAAGAIPVVGWAALAAATIYNMIKSAQKKKQQKAMEQDLKAVQQNEQLSNENTNAALQDMANSAAQKREQLKQEVANNLQQDQGYSGQLPDFDNDALKQNLMQEATAPQQPSSPESYSPQGALTGAASNIDGITSNVAGLLNDYTPIDIDELPNPSPTETLKNGLIEQIAGVGRGNDMLSDSPDTTYGQMNPPYIDKYDGMSNTDLVTQANGINDDAFDRVQQTQEEGNFSREDRDALKGNLMQNVKSGLSNFVEGYKDNSENGFIDGDVANGVKHNRGIGYKLGEAVGTGSRLMQNPYMQGALAGIAYGADKGDALYGLGKGWEWAQNRAKNNAYVNILRKAGINVPNGVLGGIGANDAAAIAKVVETPYKNKYYSGKSREANVKAGFLPNGKPVTYGDIERAVLTPEQIKEKIASGELSPDDIANLGVTQIYTTQQQANNSTKKLYNAENGIPTDYSYNVHQSYKHDPDSVTASENYLEGAKLKAEAAKNGGNGGSPSTNKPANTPNNVAPITNDDQKEGLLRKVKKKAKKVYPHFSKNGKRVSGVTQSGINYRIV